MCVLYIEKRFPEVVNWGDAQRFERFDGLTADCHEAQDFESTELLLQSHMSLRKFKVKGLRGCFRSI